MEVVTIEKRAFEAMLSRFEAVARKAEAICLKYDHKEVDWLDNQDVCLMLNISKRTLQSMRDKRVIPFVKNNRKYYYSPQDVEKILKANKFNQD